MTVSREPAQMPRGEKVRAPRTGGWKGRIGAAARGSLGNVG